MTRAFEQFPKQRPPLSARTRAIYEQHYIRNRAGDGAATSAAQKLEAWMHRRVAQASVNFSPDHRILEIGAGNLNHIDYETQFGSYDIVEPFSALYENSDKLSRLGRTYNSLSEVELENYDRILSIAVLEHMDDLPREVELSRALLATDGVFQAAIPCEGELAWELAWRMTTAIEFRLRYKADYAEIMRHEHLNNLSEIIEVIKCQFEHVVVQRSPFPLPIPHMSFYAYIEASGPKPAPR